MKLSIITISAIAVLFSSCGTIENKQSSQTYQDNCYTTQWNSNGNYNISGKTFSLLPASSSVPADNSEFDEYSRLIEKSLISSGAVKASNNETADIYITIDYGVDNHSYIEETTPNATPTSYSTEYVSPTYAFRTNHSILRKVTEYKHYINICAFTDKESNETNQVWSISAFNVRPTEELDNTMPYMAYSLRNQFGKSTQETQSHAVPRNDYTYRLYYEGF